MLKCVVCGGGGPLVPSLLPVCETCKGLGRVQRTFVMKLPVTPDDMALVAHGWEYLRKLGMSDFQARERFLALYGPNGVDPKETK